MADPDPPDWPEECPSCGEPTEQHPRTLSWWCPACGCDDEAMAMEKADRDVKAAKEARAWREGEGVN